MEQCDVIRLRGCISVALYANGKEVERITENNVVVTAGRRWILQQIASSEIATAQSIGYMAVGTGTAAPATSDSALGSETTRKAINNFTTSNLTSNPPSWQAEMSLATNEGNTTLGEVGMLNSSSGGTILNRATFSTINKTTSNTLGISYTLSG
jgi:hypothetical protein